MEEYKKCARCGEIVESWELTEIWDNKEQSHFEVCGKCKQKHYDK